MHVFRDVTNHATSMATERMLTIIDGALDDDAQRVAAAVCSAQSVYISMVMAMARYGLMKEDSIEESLKYVTKAIQLLKEEECAGSLRN